MKPNFVPTLLAVSILTACGGSDDGNNNVNPSGTVLVTKGTSITGKIDVDAGESANSSIQYKIDSPEDDIVSFDIERDGSFSLVAKPFAEPVKITISTNVNSKIESKQYTFLTQQVNDQATDDTDPLYSEQWHLNNKGQFAFSASRGTAGFDLNIGQLHRQGLTGESIHVAVVDSGLELRQEDLADNIVPGASRDLANNDNDPSPEGTSGDHGTSVAGLIAAKGFNGIGGRGVAPDAGLSGFNYLNAQTFKAFIASHGGNETKDADVINQSYGFGLPLLLPSTFFAAELAYTENYYKNNPNPFLQIKSAGNGFNELSLGLKYFSRAEQTEGESKLPHQLSNADPFNATFYNTVVSATSADENNPRSSYSTTGSSVMFAAFGGEYGVNNPAMITTDVQGCDRGYSKSYQGNYSGGLNQDIQERTDCSYTSQFNGTSSAAPVASGVAALVMEANPDLTWRDVRYIMAKTAKKIDQDFESGILYQNGQFYVAEPGWVTNAAGNTFHNWYGYGLLDATKAVQMATRGYSLLPALAETSFIEAEGLPADIPEDFNGLERTIEVSEDMLVEAVQLRVTLDHQRLNDLALEVISPSGTRSVVATPRNIHFKHISELTNSDTKAPLEALLFLSNAFLDEKAQGTWRIRAIDTNNEEVKISEWNASNNSTTTLTLPNNDSLGSLAKAELRIYGH